MVSRNERLLQSRVAKLQHRVKKLESENLQLRARIQLGDVPEMHPAVTTSVPGIAPSPWVITGWVKTTTTYPAVTGNDLWKIYTTS